MDLKREAARALGLILGVVLGLLIYRTAVQPEEVVIVEKTVTVYVCQTDPVRCTKQ